jgi:hypothetical protein
MPARAGSPRAGARPWAWSEATCASSNRSRTGQASGSRRTTDRTMQSAGAQGPTVEVIRRSVSSSTPDTGAVRHAPPARKPGGAFCVSPRAKHRCLTTDGPGRKAHSSTSAVWRAAAGVAWCTSRGLTRLPLLGASAATSRRRRSTNESTNPSTTNHPINQLIEVSHSASRRMDRTCRHRRERRRGASLADGEPKLRGSWTSEHARHLPS